MYETLHIYIHSLIHLNERSTTSRAIFSFGFFFLNFPFVYDTQINRAPHTYLHKKKIDSVDEHDTYLFVFNRIALHTFAYRNREEKKYAKGVTFNIIGSTKIKNKAHLYTHTRTYTREKLLFDIITS